MSIAMPFNYFVYITIHKVNHLIKYDFLACFVIILFIFDKRRSLYYDNTCNGLFDIYFFMRNHQFCCRLKKNLTKIALFIK